MQSQSSVLLLWTRRADDQRAGVLQQNLVQAEILVDVADLRQMMGTLSLAQSVASWASEELEATLLASVVGKSYADELRKKRPQIVIALDPVAASAASIWREKGLLPAPVIGIVDGLLFDPRWATDAIDRLLVFDEAQLAEARAAGIAEAMLVAAALDGPDAPEKGRQALREEFGIPAHRPVVLLDTADFDLGDLGDAIFQLSLLSDGTTLMIDAPDPSVAEYLRSRAEIYGVAAAMFGDVDTRDALWACADLVIARPSLKIERRAAAFSLGIVSYLAEGSGVDRAQAYARRGLGTLVSSSSLLAAEVEGLVRGDALATVAKVTQSLRDGEPLQDALGRLCGEANALLAERLQRQAAAKTARKQAKASPAQPAEDKARKMRGPLEFIGPGTKSSTISESAKQEAVEADLRRLAADEELRRIKREQLGEDALRDFETEAPRHEEEPAAPSQTAPADDSPKEPPVGLDPGFKRTFSQQQQNIEDELAELKRKMRDD